jgi:Tfp pilus assembly PilM family ATPase
LKNELEAKESEIQILNENKNDLVAKLNEIEEEKEVVLNNNLELKNEIVELKKEQVNSFIENAIKEGKITEPQKENYLKLANDDFETIKNIINAIPNRVKITDQLVNTSASALNELIKGKENWDEIDFEKKDKKTLEKIKNEFGDYYSQIHKKAYKL